MKGEPGFTETRWSYHAEQKHQDSVLIILGDFDKANLSRELPKYRQYVTCPTSESNILDHC